MSETFSFIVGQRTQYKGNSTCFEKPDWTDISHHLIATLTTNNAEALSIRNARQAAGQENIRCIYDGIEKLWQTGIGISVFWIPSTGEHKLQLSAKQEARQRLRKALHLKSCSL
jgi:hypothetical protein